MRVPGRSSRIIGKPGSPGEAQCCGGLNPGGIERWVAGKRKTPARCSVSTWQRFGGYSRTSTIRG
ncbi:hypothetical protein CF026_09145 [Klebsiella michiganensis]|nr:hypothetical protein [Klebsiella michiganensis]MBW5998362.1 hypothetical protein [Klebsiella michiganensis]